MTTRGTFPAFIRQLRKRWQLQLPALTLIAEPLGLMPKASTFYAGQEEVAGRHAFFWFQSSVMRPGEFTINVVLTETRDVPARNSCSPATLSERAPGIYRIGQIVHGRDKWWCLADNPFGGLGWRASSYGDRAAVFEEVMANVTEDVAEVLADLGLPKVPAAEQAVAADGVAAEESDRIEKPTRRRPHR